MSLKVGLLGALVSHRVLTCYEPYIEDTDDIVSEVAQTQLVLVYFSASSSRMFVPSSRRAGGLVIYANDLLEQGQGRVSDNILSCLLILIFFSTIVVAVVVVVLSTFNDSELAKFTEIAAPMLRTLSMKSSFDGIFRSSLCTDDSPLSTASHKTLPDEGQGVGLDHGDGTDDGSDFDEDSELRRLFNRVWIASLIDTPSAKKKRKRRKIRPLKKDALQIA